MATEDTVVTKFEVEGQDDVTKAFEDVGASGQKAFEDVAEASKKLDDATDRVVNNVAKMASAFKAGVGKGLSDFVTPITSQLNKLTGGSFSKIGESISSISKNFAALAGGALRVAPALANLRSAFAASAEGAAGAVARTAALGTAIGELGPVVGAVGGVLGGLVGVFGAVAAAGTALSISVGEDVSAMRNLAIAAGTTAKEMERLTFAIKQTGGNADALPLAFARLSQAQAEAASGGGEVSKKFEELGIKLLDSAGRARDVSQVFLDLAEVIGKIKDPADRAAKAGDLLGVRLGRQLAASLGVGKDALSALGDEQERLAGLTDEQRAAFVEQDEALGQLGEAFKGLKQNLATLFTPSVIAGAKALTGAIEALNGLLGQTGPKAKEAGDGVKQGLGLTQQQVNELQGTVNSFSFDKFIASATKDLSGLSGIAKLVTQAAARELSGLAGLTNFKPVLDLLRALGNEIVPAAHAEGVEAGAALGTGAQEGAKTTLAQVPLEATKAGDETKTNLEQATTGVDFQPIVDAATTSFQAIADQSGQIDFSTTFQGVVNAAQQSFSQLPQIASNALQSVTAVVTQASIALASIFTGPVATATAQLTSLGTAGKLAGDGIKTSMSGVAEVINGIAAAATGASDAFNEMARSAAAAAAAARDANAAAQGNAGGGAVFAGGGRVYGAGTGTSDSIPAWLSHGEWVIKAAAVRKYGHGIFAALNSMRLSPNMMRGLLRGFKMGGMVDMSSGLGAGTPLKLSGGGAVDSAGGVSRQTINLTIGGQTFAGLLAPKEVADKLTRFALNEQVKSGGRKPSWYYGSQG